MKYFELPATKAETAQAERFGLLGKSWKINIASAICLLTFIVISPGALMGQSYSVDWYKIAGGGGASAGGNFQVSGTIGQPDASGGMNGGNYSVTGGFWSLYAVQIPGAPVLAIALTATNTAVVSWPSPSTGYNLQMNTDLSTTNWVTPVETVTDNGTIKYIIVNHPTGKRFYRLQHP